MKRCFVTGTDTGVGKTFVTAALARRARHHGRRVFAFKPIETGTRDELGDDQRALCEAAGGWQQGFERGLYQFALPAAPSVAARAEQRAIDVDHIRRIVEDAEARADVVLVEGAGGLRVPVTETLDMAGLAHVLAMPVIVVARAGLGTINHTLLTVEAAEHMGLRVAAVVISRRPTDDPDFTGSNATEIARRWNGTVLTLADDPAVLDSLIS